ncbi:sensor histidine kinase [Microbacterium hominis]|uniref:histidine kinase n=1 Tax=Microbacterium hominis TaxID=162426 RepID=A0A7D4UHF3_9MICO|nr:histidine kinase [Microbacterium hominis]QKJ20789.1 sensor histidine kinase [Microbacterium hominis]
MTATVPAMPKDPQPRVPAWAVDALIVVIMVPLTLVTEPGRSIEWPSPATIGLVILAAVALPFRRRWPLPILGVELGIFALAAVVGGLPQALSLAVAVAMFQVTNRMPRREGLVATGITLAVVTGFGLIAWVGDGPDPRLVQFALTTAIGSALGDATRSRREYIEAITDRAERAERTREAEARRRVSEERLRIARDLHDAVAHQISVISLNAGVASAAVDERPEKAKEALATIRSASRTVLGEIGGLLDVLRAADDDPATAPGPNLARLDELTRQFADAGLDVSVRVEGDLSRAPSAVSLVAYRVIQEALTNAHKHGDEHRAHVLLTVQDDALTVVVTNPTAAGAASTSPGSRRGLVGVRERVATVRGVVETGSAPGGWRVTARLPLPTGDSA